VLSLLPDYKTGSHDVRHVTPFQGKHELEHIKIDHFLTFGCSFKVEDIFFFTNRSSCINITVMLRGTYKEECRTELQGCLRLWHDVRQLVSEVN
jgi:hypothetical protein